MPNVNSYFEQNAQSPPPHNKIPTPTPHTRSFLTSPNAQRQLQDEQLTANLIELMLALLDRFGFEVCLTNLRQHTQSSQWSSQSTLALSDCEPPRHPLPTTRTSEDFGADSVCDLLPAINQRIKASPNPSQLAATSLTPTLTFQKFEWDRDDRDLFLKSSNRAHYTESSGICICVFVEDAENCLKMCGRYRDRWARFIISWVCPNNAEKVRRFHFVANNVDHSAFRKIFSLYFVAWIFKIRTGNNFACSFNPAPNP